MNFIAEIFAQIVGVEQDEEGDEAIGGSGPELSESRLPSSIEIPITEALELLANDRRRLTVQIVAEADRDGQATDVGRLAEGIASFEYDCAPNELDSQKRKRVYVSLYQGHVKKLDAVGAVSVDDPEHPDEVRATNLTHGLDALLQTLEDVFEGPRGTPCPECGTPMAHELPGGGQAAPCGCEVGPMQGQPGLGVSWQ